VLIPQFLRRPPFYNQEWRLDQILKRKAAEGVKIYIIVYKEVSAHLISFCDKRLTIDKVSAALTCNSQHTKKVMMNLIKEGEPGYGNINLMRHPDHNVLENAGDMTFYWVALPLQTG
jgi:phospholipase D1/2